MKINTKHNLFFLLALIIVLISGFGFLNIEKANAGGCTFSQKCTGGDKTYDYTQEVSATNDEDCQKNCNSGWIFKKKYLNDSTCGNNEGCKYYADEKEAQKAQQEAQKENNKKNLVQQRQAEQDANSDICGIDIFSPTSIFKCPLIIILRFVGLLLSIAASIFNWVIKPDTLKLAIDNQAIYIIWSKVRDTLNVAFILTLLFSAFCTVFQIQKFSYKNILMTVIIMALLVNFSFPIARVIIDFANVVMYYFLNSMGGGSFENIVKSSGLASIINTKATADFVYIIAAIVFVFIFAVTLLTIAVLLVIRTIALGILIIFSPIAFVGSIVPFLSTHSKKWWDALFNYSFFGPIMVFMLYISSELMKTMAGFKGSFSNIANVQAPMGTMSEFIASASFFAIPIVILWMGIGVAKSMSIAGAGAVTAKAEKFMKNPFGAKSGVKFLAKKTEQGLAKDKYGKFLSPTVWKTAWKKRSEMQEREAFEQSSGEMHDILNKTLSTASAAVFHPLKTITTLKKGKRNPHIEKTDYGFAAHEGKVSKYSKEISDVSPNADYVIEQLKAAIANKNVAKAEAAVKLLAKDNNLNDMMHAIGDQYGKKEKIASPVYIKEALKDILSQAGAGKNEDNNEFLAKQLMGVGDIAVSSGNVGLAGMAKYDNKINKFRVSTNGEQANAAASKFQNLEPQKRQLTLHHNSVLGEDAEGKVATIDEVQQAVLKKFGKADLEQLNRSRDDLRRQFERIETGGDGVTIKEKEKMKEGEETPIETFNRIKNDNPDLKEYARRVKIGDFKGTKKEESKSNSDSNNSPQNSDQSDQYKKSGSGLYVKKW